MFNHHLAEAYIYIYIHALTILSTSEPYIYLSLGTAQHSVNVSNMFIILTSWWHHHVRYLLWPTTRVSHGEVSTLRSFQSLQRRHNERDIVWNHQPHDCLLNRLFRHISMKTSKLRGTGLCEGNSPVTGEFPAQMASNADNVSIWWRHHVFTAHKANAFPLKFSSKIKFPSYL